MKCALRFVVALSAGIAASAGSTSTKDRTITKVVKMLQEMLEKSKADGDKDRDLFAKYKCYCDENEETRKNSIKDLKKEILVLESKIAKIQGSTGELSTECADLKSAMAENEAAREAATTLREKEHADFVAEEADLSGGIDQMEEAIKVLSEIGADQTLAVGADHEQFMAGKEMGPLLELKAQVHSALLAASNFAPQKQRGAILSFLQAPFTGTYSAQSGEIVGILKNMRDTFKGNLASAIAAEKKAVEAYEKFMKLKKAAFEEMKAAYETKQGNLGENDDDLASKREQLEEAKEMLAEDEDFLAKLLVMCKDKTEEYERRKQMRANEEAAIAEAIAILNSDAAFESFGKVKATKSGATGFLQLSSVRKHADADARSTVQALLRAAAGKRGSLRLAKIAVLLEAGNPFTVVLAEIEKILAIISEEGKVDKENLDWCNAEREENHKILEAHIAAIETLGQEISDLDILINDPETGLLAQIKQTEDALTANHESQVSETTKRSESNLNYQTNIGNIVEAEGLLEKAIKILKAHYKYLEEGEATSLAQEDPAPPSTWEDEEGVAKGFRGQSEKGTQVIEMLEFILNESKKEEAMAHQDEEKAQHDFEDSMADLKKEEADLMKTLAELNATLAEKRAELEQKKAELEKETAGKLATEAYLEKIKPGCDFITEHFEYREESRASEAEALKKAIEILKGSPAYQAAVASAEEESFGECKAKCIGQKEHVECKACLAEVTIPAYCAGHAGTEGC